MVKHNKQRNRISVGEKEFTPASLGIWLFDTCPEVKEQVWFFFTQILLKLE